MQRDNVRYDYSQAGFDAFLSRSIDTGQATLSSGQVPQTRQISFDRSQVAGALGDIFRIGRISLDGVTGRISILDDNDNEVVRIGKLDDD